MGHLARICLLSLGLSAPLAAQEGSGELFQKRVASLRALEEWREGRGRGWQERIDPRTGRVEFLGGGRAAALFEPKGDEDFVSLGWLAVWDGSRSRLCAH